MYLLTFKTYISLVIVKGCQYIALASTVLIRVNLIKFNQIFIVLNFCP
jgi:hypothetical protein